MHLAWAVVWPEPTAAAQNSAPVSPDEVGTMLISRVDRETVASAAAAREALNRGSLAKGLLLQVRSPQGGVNFVLLQAGGNG